MIRTIIFDLSEVLIPGLIGIEEPLSVRLQVASEEVLAAFGGRLLEDLCRGNLSEDVYLSRIVRAERWEISTGWSIPSWIYLTSRYSPSRQSNSRERPSHLERCWRPSGEVRKRVYLSMIAR